jgi:hypothetical protein
VAGRAIDEAFVAPFHVAMLIGADLALSGALSAVPPIAGKVPRARGVMSLASRGEAPG